MAHSQLSNIKLLVGLGNPGKAYEHTYHNVGRLFADYLLEDLSSGHAANELKFRKSTASKNFEYLKTENVIFVKPLLFMNENGAAVQAALKFFSAEGGSASGGKIKPKELLIIHDDSDIELGGYKISFGRGAGGHRGIESIIQKLGTKDFWRLRIGVRKANPPSSASDGLRRARAGLSAEARRAKAGDFVLKKISRTDEKMLHATFEDIEKRAMTLLQRKVYREG